MLDNNGSPNVFSRLAICIRDGLVLPPAPPVIKSEILFFTQKFAKEILTFV